MKKLLLTTAACGVAFSAAPAFAQVKLDLGGYTGIYAVYTDQDDAADTGVGAVLGDSREFDILRSTEIHFGGETTLDNGLTVGAHFEMEADGNYAEGNNLEESYIYMSGSWGRVNVGAEDGAAYLLQVAAPSADDWIDGARVLIQPFNYINADSGLADNYFAAVDYDQDVAPYADKFTYLSPIMNGLQLGLSYTPDVADASTEVALNENDIEDAFGASYEAAVRYEGMFNNVGVNVGAGYTLVDLEKKGTQATGDAQDDRAVWNVGLDLNIGPFGIGAVYLVDDYGEVANSATTTRDDEKTWVVGVDYTTGPFKLGASYLDQDGTQNVAGAVGTDGVETKKYTGGVTYTYGPGMTFRGSISHIKHDNVATTGPGDKIDATSVLLGTVINF